MRPYRDIYPVRKLRSLTGFTNNPNRLVNFYKKALGFKEESRQIVAKNVIKSIFGLDCRCLMIRLGKGALKIEIFKDTSIRFRKRAKNSLGYNHWGYFVGNRGVFIKTVKSKAPVIKVERNGRFAYFIKDPDGNLIELRD